MADNSNPPKNSTSELEQSQETMQKQDPSSSAADSGASGKRPVENTIGRLIVALVLVGGAGSFVIAMFYSLYSAVSRPPKVYASVPGKPGKRVQMRSSVVRKCIRRLRKLDKELEHESTALWHRLRKGNRLSLRLWKDWAQDWKRRMQLLQRQCPFKGDQKLPRAFQRASRRMLILHQRQVTIFSEFYKKNAWLFHEIRQGMRTLKEDIP